MSDGNPFRGAGGPRGVDHIRDIGRVRRLQGRGRLDVDAGIVDIDDRHAVPVESLGQFGGGDRRDRCGIGQHEFDASRRCRRVDRQVSRPGLEHGQNRHDRLGGPRKEQCHALSRARPEIGQQMCQPVGRLVEFSVRQGTALAGDGDFFRGARDMRSEQSRNRVRLTDRRGQHRSITDLVQPRAFGPDKHIH